MITHLLDTDALTLFQHGHPQVTARCTAALGGTLGLTIISVEEQFLGWYTRARQAKRDDDIASAYDRMTEFATFVRHLPIVSFGEKAIQQYRHLRTLKLNVAKKDLCIAAIALQVPAVVVTRNAVDFGRVPGLVTEDWST